MITSVRESKARLSELVNRAVAGEEVLITVRGRPTARIVAMKGAPEKKSKPQWVSELRRLRRNRSGNPKAISSQPIIDELREERT
jgi:prevent-host-death family protein